MSFIFEVILAVWTALCDAVYWAVISVVPLRFLPKYDIKGQVALVTGGGNGLGRLFAVRLAKEGVGTVVIWDVDKAAMKETCMLIEKVNGCKAVSYYCDVGDPKTVAETAARVKDEVGIVKVLVNNAGIASGNFLLESSQEAIQKVYAVNTLAHYWTVRAFLPDMIGCQQGLIMAISSAAGLHGLPRGSEYSGAKFAVIGFMESLKMELMEKKVTGVSTTIICPHFSDTGMFTCEWDGLVPLQDPVKVVDYAVEALLTGKERVTVPWTYGPAVALLRLVFGVKGLNAIGLIAMGKMTSETLKMTRPAAQKIPYTNGCT